MTNNETIKNHILKFINKQVFLKFQMQNDTDNYFFTGDKFLQNFDTKQNYIYAYKNQSNFKLPF